MIKLLHIHRHFRQAIELYLKELNVSAPMVFNFIKSETADHLVQQADKRRENAVLYNEGAFGGMVMNLILATKLSKSAKKSKTIIHASDETRPDRLPDVAKALFRKPAGAQPPNPANDSYSSNRGA